ncbi:MAG: sugar phosphate isomerase/epimerase [Planctomycetota bacterium]|nr:sugar phosphate isomerase/epimerase [Planctomycetota bacterium]
MPERPSVLLSAFADEATRPTAKTCVEQLAAMAALGLRYYSPRFLDVRGTGEIGHVVELDESGLAELAKLNADYGMSVASIGSRVGKVKLRDQPDQSHNKFVPFERYLETEVRNTIRAAHGLRTKLVRGFSFYGPAGEDPRPYVAEAVDRLGTLADLMAAEGLIYGLEIEPNLVGQTGPLLATIAEQVNRPNLVLIYDGGNIAAQNKDALTCFSEYEAMRPHLGWMHVKDYAIDRSLTWSGYVDEERLKNFVPADEGDSGHELVFRDLREHVTELGERMRRLGAPGFFVEVEPHLKGGGQFGGYSGPDGMGVAVRSLCRLLDYSQIDYGLRTFEDIRKDRGF